MNDAWVWDIYRPARFVKNVRVVTFKDVNVEELAKSDLELPEERRLPAAPDAAGRPQPRRRRPAVHSLARRASAAGRRRRARWSRGGGPR